ncbi:MAG: hypothetical protein Kow0063_30250 [Anaerolineae bacterium]
MMVELTTALALVVLAVLRLGVPLLVIVLLSIALRRIQRPLA